MRDGSSSISWLFSYHLGSMAITATYDGTVTGELRYKAWGEIRYTWGTTPTTYQYTGQRIESYINLYWYGSRWYDPVLGRWIQPDSIIPEATQGVQAWDRYAYVNNNPVRYNDPTGHSLDCAIGEENCDAGEYVDGEEDDQSSLEENLGEVFSDVAPISGEAIAGASTIFLIEVVGAGLAIPAAIGAAPLGPAASFAAFMTTEILWHEIIIIPEALGLYMLIDGLTNP